MNKGSCLCGDIQWQVEGPPNMMMNCYCSVCRKLHGTDFVTFIGYGADGFKWLAGEDKVRLYASTPGGPAMRASCPKCGSKVAVEMPDGSSVFMPAGNLEGDIDRLPDFNCFVGSKAPWTEIPPGSTSFEGFPDGYDGPTLEDLVRPPATAAATGGSCHCGKVSFEFDMPFERMGYCHCSLCRKSVSGAMSSEVFVESEDFRWLAGEDNLERYDHPDSHFSLHFCRDCGSLMPIHLGDEEDLYLVPAGSLDQDPGIRPMGHIFVGSKANWDEIADDLPRFEEWPAEAG